MSLAPNSLPSRRLGYFGALLTALVGWLFALEAFGPGLANRSYDLLLRMRPPLTPEGVTLVYMDPSSASALKQPASGEWDHARHAELLRSLTQGHARAVVFDILFQDETTNSYLLVQAVTNAIGRGTLVFAAAKYERLTGPARKILRPLPNLQRAGVEWGLVVGEASRENSIRKHVPDNAAGDPSLAGLLARRAWATPVAASDEVAWINYYGRPYTTFRSLGYREVFELPAAELSNVFSNQVVIVGGLSEAPPAGGIEIDEWPSPWGGRRFTGSEIMATACLNLARGDALSRWPRWAEAGLVMAIGLSLGFVFGTCRPTRAAWMAVLLGVAVAGMALVGVWKYYLWFPWRIVAAVQVPLALGWSVLVQTRRLARENQMLEEKMSAIEPVLEMAAARLGSGAAVPLPGRHAPPRLASAVAEAEGELSAMPTVLSEAPPMRMPPIPDHTLLRCVGRGAYGEVHLARNEIGTFHAVKVVYRTAFSSEEPFEREFRGVQKFMPISRLHPAFVQILHVGRNAAARCFYCVMEPADDEVHGTRIEPETYVPRTVASELARRRKLPADECVRLGLALSAGLEYLHGQNLIHRDIKPSNIIYTRGEPKFADIGLVTDVAATGVDVTYLGTKGYIAPEGPGRPAADIFSLGRVLYEAWSGLPSAQCPSLPDTLMQRADCELGWDLNGIILKACDPDLAQRYVSASQLRADLERLR